MDYISEYFDENFNNLDYDLIQKGLIVFAFIFFALLVIKGTVMLFNIELDKRKASIPQIFVREFSKVPVLVLFITSFYFGMITMNEELNNDVVNILATIFLVIALYYFVRHLNKAIGKTSKLWAQEYVEKSQKSAVLYVSMIIRITIWILTFTESRSSERKNKRAVPLKG